MPKPPLPHADNKDEKQRLQELQEYQILNTAAEDIFDAITKTAAEVCGTKIALISFVDECRQWFKSAYGLDAKETPRDVAFCAHAIMGHDLFLVEDTSLDKRFKDNPLVKNAPFIKFYAGQPLITPTGRKLGTLCVIDSEKKILNHQQKQVLKELAKQIITILELKKKNYELHETQNKLEQSIAKQVKFFATISEGYVLQDDTSKIIDFNSHAPEILGLTENQFMGRDSFDPRWSLIQEDGTAFVPENHPSNVALKTQKPVRDVIMGVSLPDGKLNWIKINSTPYFENGRIVTITTFTDITKEKTQNHKLNESNTYLDLALEGAGLGIWDWYLINNEVKFDRRWATMLGLDYEKIEMKLSTWESRVHPDDLKKCYQDIQAYMNGQTPYYENIHRMRHEKGHWVYILDRGRFSEWDSSGKAIRFTGTHLDITETKMAQEARLNEIKDILTSTPSCLKVIDRAGKLLEMNEQGLCLIEADNFDSVKGANLYDLVEPGHREAFKNFNERVCNGSRESLVFEMVALKGTRRWMESYAAPFKLPNGETAHIAIANDITKRIEDGKEMQKQKAISLHQAKLASIGELAAGVGHEINNPLAIIKGHITNAMRKFGQADNVPFATLKPYLEKIDIATNRIAKIVQGLRTFSRSDATQIQKFSPHDALYETVGLVHEIYHNLGINLSLNSHEENKKLLIKGNLGHFQQVIMNLLSNAKDALEEVREKSIEISLWRDGAFVKLSIKDTGTGIPANIREQIFDPFFTTKEVNKGSGIGLSLVHKFITEIQGQITFESSKEMGTCFMLTIPLC